MEENVFYGCTLKPLYFEDPTSLQSRTLSGLNQNSVILVPEVEDVNIVKEFFDGEIYPNFKYLPRLIKSYLGGLEFSLWENIYSDKTDSITDIIVAEKSLNVNKNNTYEVYNLVPDSVYDVTICFQREEERFLVIKPNIRIPKTEIIKDTIFTQFKTLTPAEPTIKTTNITQTICHAYIVSSKDSTIIPSEQGAYVKGGEQYKADFSGNIKFERLIPDKTYYIQPYAIYNGKTFLGSVKEIKTDKVLVGSSIFNSTVKSLSVRVSHSRVDSGLVVQKKGVEYFHKYSYTWYKYYSNSENLVIIENLSPGESYRIKPFVIFECTKAGENIIVYDEQVTYKTKVPAFRSNLQSTVTPTSIDIAEWPYELYDATLKEVGFSAPKEVVGNKAFFTGLNPGTSYNIEGYLVVEEGNYRATSTISISTPALKMTTLPAKATSNTKAVICAETNIANEETGTGFEFRRIDAPDLVPSTVVYCAVHDGVMEGILNNLSANTYYKYRPFYKSAAGNMYYGDWIGFGTADAYVYFTPTVHTYATATVENNTATLNGYALAGSDDIVEQGFEYWTDGATHTRATGEVMTVTATGQRMSITLNDLQYNTTYKYRAYVKTAKETTYGEEMSFSTGDDPTGIGEVSAEGFSVEVRTVQGGIGLRLTGEPATARYALYTLNGTSIANGQLTSGEEWQRVGDASLPQGLYLLRVENNKLCRTVKVMVK